MRILLTCCAACDVTGVWLPAVQGSILPALLDCPGMALAADTWSMLVMVRELLAKTSAYAELSAQLDDLW